MKNKYYQLNDLFEFPSIKGITKEFIGKNKGDIPVYGGKINETPIGYIKDNLSDVKYFENCLGWNREGSVGYVFYHKNKFTTNDHHRPMILKQEYFNVIDLNYIKIFLQQKLLSMGFRWSVTAGKEIVSSLSIDIPIDINGNFNIEAQKEIANRFLEIEKIKQKTIDELEKITNVSINLI